MGFTYTRRSLTDFVQSAKAAVDPALRIMAEDGSKYMVRIVRENTPVETMKLRDSIQESPIKPVAEGGYESGAFTDVSYGPHVEHGTGLWGPKHAKYKIEPKDPNGVLAFFVGKGAQARLSNGKYTGGVSEGKLVFARYVMHPGSPGQHMFATGVAWIEASFDEVTDRGLNEWARRSER